MTPSVLRQILMVVTWTVLVGLGVYLVDRSLGPGVKEGWIVADSPAEIPEEAGRTLAPAYLPGSVRWPPARVFFRVAPSPGWWLELRSMTGDETQLWVGSGTPPEPAELGEAGLCLGPTGCPPEWHVLSAKGPENRPVRVLAKLPLSEAVRVTEMLRE